MPMIVLFFGIAGAFVTTSMSSTNVVTTEKGYRYLSPLEPCHYEAMCSNVQNPITCTSGGITLKGKDNPNIDLCFKPLYKIP